MVGWHRQFNGHEFEPAAGDSEGQGSLACNLWGCQELDMTEWLTTTVKFYSFIFLSVAHSLNPLLEYQFLNKDTAAAHKTLPGTG